MKLQITDQILVSDISAEDKPAVIQHLQEKQIYDQTLNIPYPYGEADADWWINHVAEETKREGRSINWGIRDQTGFLIGGIGFHNLSVGKSHQAEIGYWLAKPYWGRGIVTQAAMAVTDYGFAELDLVRITAHIFAFNRGSERVLEKCGYLFEGTLRKNYKKNGQFFDGKLYAKVI